MLNDFLDYFNEENRIVYSNNLYDDFIFQLGGKQFGKGIFRSFSKSNLIEWENIVADVYPEFKGMFKLFGYDWLGRCFGIDLREESRGKVLMFEIGTVDVLEIPCSFEDFLNQEIPLFSEACLAEQFFFEWLDTSKTKMKYDRCAAYIIPLFLGGEDIVANLEDSDMEVYWEIVAQIKKQI